MGGKMCHQTIFFSRDFLCLVLFCCVLCSSALPVLCICYYQFLVHCPFLVLQTNGALVAGKEASVIVEFTNPLKQTLENVTLRLEGPGVLRTIKKQFG